MPNCENCGELIVTEMVDSLEREADDEWAILGAGIDSKDESYSSTMAEASNKLSRLLDIINEDEYFEGPMCTPCHSKLMEGQYRQIRQMKYEGGAFQKAFQALKSPSKKVELENHSIVLQTHIEKLKEAIRKADNRIDDFGQHIERLKGEEQEMQNQHVTFWEEIRHLDTINSIQNDVARGESRTIREYVKQEDILNGVVVLFDIFCISRKGYIGTINGFRLGTLSNDPVPFSEINAALGQCAFLVDTVAHVINCPLPHVVYPRGSFSKIVVDKKQLDLFLHKGKNKHFDQALISLMSCIHSLGDFVAKSLGKPLFKYRINNHLVGDYSVLKTENDYDQWTKAMKGLLINLKSLLAFTANSYKQQKHHWKKVKTL